MTLWMTPSLRYFLVPDDYTWPPGADALTDVLGAARRVDLAAMAALEVPPARARAFAEAETRRIEASLGPQPAAPNLDALRADLQALADRAGGVDASIQRLLAAIGLPVDRLTADPESTVRLWSEVVATVAVAKDKPARERLPEQLAALLTRHGYPEAARKLRDSPARLRRWVESLPKAPSPTRPPPSTGDPGPTHAQRLAAALAAVGPSLSDSERIELQSLFDAQEHRLALEQAAYFLFERDAAVPGWVKAEFAALAELYRTDRASLDGLPEREG